jgi:cell fate (sporulation/competence/biofilm development) regulator YlbF (YheA/YmcA/DUF963 family)
MMENKEIMELATKLGDALKNDERLVRLEQARVAYENDPVLRKHMVEYEVQQKAMQNEVAKEEKDMHFIKIIQRRIDELYHLIIETPAFVELNEAQEAVNAYMNEVNQTIMSRITGEEPGCTHNCATCKGCH